MMTITANTIATDTPMATCTARLFPCSGAVDVVAVVVVIGLGGGSVVRGLHISGNGGRMSPPKSRGK